MANSRKVLSTTRLHPDAAAMLKGIASLEENPLPPLGMFTKEQLLEKVRDVDAVILFGEEFDRDIMMKKTSYLMNVARGPLVDQDSFYNANVSGDST